MRQALEVSCGDVQMIQDRHRVAYKLLQRIGFRIMRCVADTVLSCIDEDDLAVILSRR
jgi:hypothetical protein